MAYKAPAASTTITGVAKFDDKDVLVTSGLVQHKCGLQPGPHNLGITYAGGTLTVCSASTAALSATNPAYVTLQSKTPGKLVTVAVTANQTLTDGAAGSTATQRFGLTTGVNWANDIPFFLHAVLDDAETAISFMITRNPAASVSPAAANIGKTGAVVNGGQGDFFAMGNPTVADYEANPCLCIGSFRAQFVGATDSWTISALAANDGIGQFNNSTVFTMPDSVNGAAAGTYVLSNAGTEPTWTTQSCLYKIDRNGNCLFRFRGNICNNIPAGANTLYIILPYAASIRAQDCIVRYYNATTNAPSLAIAQIDAGNSYFGVIKTLGAGNNSMTNASMAANFELHIDNIYPAF